MAYQTLECDRRGGLAARERREELSDPVPVLCDPIEVTRNLLTYKFARFWALPCKGLRTPGYPSKHGRLTALARPYRVPDFEHSVQSASLRGSTSVRVRFRQLNCSYRTPSTSARRPK